jgi:hypothetical protein
MYLREHHEGDARESGVGRSPDDPLVEGSMPTLPERPQRVIIRHAALFENMIVRVCNPNGRTYRHVLRRKHAIDHRP